MPIREVIKLVFNVEATSDLTLSLGAFTYFVHRDVVAAVSNVLRCLSSGLEPGPPQPTMIVPVPELGKFENQGITLEPLYLLYLQCCYGLTTPAEIADVFVLCQVALIADQTDSPAILKECCDELYARQHAGASKLTILELSGLLKQDSLRKTILEEMGPLAMTNEFYPLLRRLSLDDFKDLLRFVPRSDPLDRFSLLLKFAAEIAPGVDFNIARDEVVEIKAPARYQLMVDAVAIIGSDWKPEAVMNCVHHVVFNRIILNYGDGGQAHPLQLRAAVVQTADYRLHRTPTWRMAQQERWSIIAGIGNIFGRFRYWS